MSEIRKIGDVRMHHDVEHELKLENGQVATIPRATRIRLEDLRVEHKPRIAGAKEVLENSDGFVPVAVPTELQALAALERRELDVVALEELEVLKHLQTPFLVIGERVFGEKRLNLVAREPLDSTTS